MVLGAECGAMSALHPLELNLESRFASTTNEAVKEAPRRRRTSTQPEPEPGEEPAARLSTEAIFAKREAYLGKNLALFFREDPLQIVAASGCLLYDEHGRDWLDCINNVSTVGHSHPKVAGAISQQLHTLNTNSRYLNQGLVDYAEALQATMPDPLQVSYLVCSGSEANDLAWRMACTAARRSGWAGPLHAVVIDHAYHGHTSATIDLSPYKFDGPGGAGCPEHVHVMPCPDAYRGTHLDGAAAARAALAEAHAAGARVAMFIAESVVSCGGQVILPEGYLAGVYSEMRAAGAVCVADEVQCGFARVGSHYWGFQLQEVVPDIVSIGKPIGNGFPMGALVTSRALADTFAAGGMEFFATTGGCNAAVAAGMAVLGVIRDEGLQGNAAHVGGHLLRVLRGLQAQHALVGDVRGVGLMLGVELVTDPASKTHAPAVARFIKDHCKREHRVLLSCEGPYANILKIKPPLCFTLGEADRLVAAMAAALEALRVDPGLAHQLVQQSREELEVTQQRHRERP